MSWPDPQWEAFCGLVEEAWPGDFDDDTARSWRVLLDGLEPEAAVQGLRRLLLQGHRFRPSVSEVLAAVHRDPSRPTFEEAYRLIYGASGVLKAEPPRDGGLVRYGSEAERIDLYDQAAIERAKTMHPLVASFVVRYGLGRLRMLAVNDPDWGEKHRCDLERAWQNHVEATDGRQVAAIAAGPQRRGLRQLDPLAALGINAQRAEIDSQSATA